MKRPKPRNFGLNSDHAPLMSSEAYGIGPDPDQPITQAELDMAAYRLLRNEAIAERQRKYAQALADYDYLNGGR